MAWHAVADDQARLHVECGEQRGRAVALVIVGHGRRAPLLQRQPGLGPVERLDLRLFIHAQNNGPFRRVEIEPHDLGHLLLEQRVVRDLELPQNVRLQPGIGPDAPDARRRDAHCLGHRGAAPVGGIGRGLPHRLGDHLQACFPRQRRHPRRPGLVAPEPSDTLVKVTSLPAPDRRLRRVRAPHDLKGAATVRRRQNDLRPPRELARGVAVGHQCLKLQAVIGAKVKANVIASHGSTMTHLTLLGNPSSGGKH